MPYIADGTISVNILLIASAIGVAAGGLLCLIQRKQWSLSVALFDALLAPLSAVAIAYAVLELDKYGSAYYSPAIVVLPVAVGSIVVKHLVWSAF